MLILGFESTAHTFGAAVVESKVDLSAAGKAKAHPLTPQNTKIISETDMKFPSLKEGFIPRRLADFHAKNFDRILDATLEKAKITLSDLDAVCYSYGPGIGHCLHLGHVAAKSISVSKNIPIMPVNHALSHIEIGRFLFSCKDPLAIYVSGGNTQIMVLENGKKKRHYRVLGETLDIGLGNFLDHVGRHFQLSPPDAVGVMNEAVNGKNLIDLPYIVKGMNASFSGVLTAAIKLNPAKHSISDICYSAQEYAFSALLEASERALTLTRKREIIGVGGNYRNKRLQEMTIELAKEHDIGCCFPPFGLLGDNAGMITITGALQFASNCYRKDTSHNQKARIDAEIVGW
ncbi:MAG: UGMP family protein [Candidatus Micrarchaeota archaeon]